MNVPEEEIFNDVKGIKLRCKIVGRGHNKSSHVITITPATKLMELEHNNAVDVIVLTDGNTVFTPEDLYNRNLELWISKAQSSELNLRMNIFTRIVGSGVGANDSGDPTLLTVENFWHYNDILKRLIDSSNPKENPEIQKKRNQLLKELRKFEPDFPDVLTNNPTPQAQKLIQEYEKLPELKESVELKEMDNKQLFDAIKSKTPDIPDRIIQGAIYDFKNDVTKNETQIRTQNQIDRAKRVFMASKNWGDKGGFQ